MIRLLILIPLAITIYALIDSIMASKTRVRGLPKWAWILLIVVTTIIGAVAWFLWGRPRRAGHGLDRLTPYIRPVGPDDDPEFLSSLSHKKPHSDQ
ncbi:MAG: PLD nuclease N-terminal domain-containing protein [Actinomycetes bacterium]